MLRRKVSYLSSAEVSTLIFSHASFFFSISLCSCADFSRFKSEPPCFEAQVSTRQDIKALGITVAKSSLSSPSCMLVHRQGQSMIEG